MIQWICAAFLTAIVVIGLSGVHHNASAATGDLPLSPASLVAGDSLDIDAALGFSGVFRLNRWSPLIVTVRNRGSNLIGQLEIETLVGDEFVGLQTKLIHRRNIELARDSRKRYRFTLFLDSPTEPVQVRVSSNGREIAKRTINIRSLYHTGDLVVVLSRDANLDYLNQRGDQANETGLRVVYPLPELLPDHWQGYDSVSAVIVNSLSLERLSETQFDALKRWLAGGGTLVFSGGADYGLLRTLRLAELIGAVPIGMGQVTQPHEAGRDANQPNTNLLADVPRPFDVNLLERYQGKVLEHAAGTPLIIKRPIGRGRSVYLTFDITRAPFARWQGMNEFFRQLIDFRANDRVYKPATRKSESLVAKIIRNQPSSQPKHGTVFFFLALYLGTLATGYRLVAIKAIKLPALRGVLWGAPLGFAAIAFGLFGPWFFPKGTSAVVLATIETFSGSSLGKLEFELGTYSNQNTSAQISYAGADPGFVPIARVGSSPATGQTHHQTWVLQRGQRRSLEPVSNRPYTLNLVEGSDIVDFDLDATLDKTNNGLELRVRNDSGQTLHNAWVLIDKELYPVGSIATGKKITQLLAVNDATITVANVGWRDLLAGSGAGELNQEAAKSLLNRWVYELRTAQPAARNTPLLIGLSMGPLHLTGHDAPRQLIELALVLCKIGLTPEFRSARELNRRPPDRNAND